VSEEKRLELRVSVDVDIVVTAWRWGYRVGRCSKSSRSITGLRVFKSFSRIEKHRKAKNCPVAVAMEANAATPGHWTAWCGAGLPATISTI
jgi:hypothetical protein